MLGPSHALSAAAAWLAGCLTVDHFGQYHQTPLQLAVGTAICAGGAMLPDMDLSGRVLAARGGATVAHTFGVVSLFAAEVVEKISLGLYRLTRLARDPRRDNGHRTLTHTLLFNIGVGFGTGVLCTRYGGPAVVGVLFFAFAMALRGLFEHWAKRAGWFLVTLASAAAACWVYHRLPSGRGYPVLGLALGAGGILHLFGDMLTRHGCPLLWPIPLGRRLWRCFRLPGPLTIQVGGAGEVYVARTLFALAALITGGLLVVPSLLARLHIPI